MDSPGPAEKSLVDSAYKRLKRDILSLERKPGEQLKIEHLKSLYGVGMGPLREALQRLAGDGLVRQQSQRGFAVASLSIGECNDLTQTRIFIEGHALTLSMRNGDDRWEAAVVGAAYRLEKYDRQLQSGELDELSVWEEVNREFHEALIQACDSPWVLRLRSILYEQHERYRRASIGKKRLDRNLDAEHQAICQAVLARDEALARRLIADHIESTARGFEAWAAHMISPDRNQVK